jgi:hypothetical protein
MDVKPGGKFVPLTAARKGDTTASLSEEESMAKTRAPRAAKSKVSFEFNVLDDATKARVARCIEKNGKVTVSMNLRGRLRAGADGGFEQKVD